MSGGGSPHSEASSGDVRREPGHALGAVELLLSLGKEAQSTDPARSRECLRRALDLARSASLDREAGHALRALGSLELFTGDIEQAEQLIEEARAKLEGAGDDLELAVCRNTLAAIYLRQGRTDEALACLRANLPETSDLTPSDEAMAARAETLEQLGAIYRDLGDGASALRSIQDALELRRAAKDLSGVAQDLDHLGKLYLRRGALQDARRVFLEAIEMRRAHREPRGLAISLNHLASTLILLGELREAHAHFEESRQLFTQLGQPRGLASVLSNLGLLATAIGRMDEADAHLAESLRLYRELRDVPAEVSVLNNLSYAAYVRGRAADAVRFAEESLALRRHAGLEGSLAKPLFNLGRAQLELDRLTDAASSAAAAVESARRSASAEQRAESLSLLSEVRLREAERLPSTGTQAAEARLLAEEAHAAAEGSGDPRLIALTERGLALVDLAVGDLAAAQEHLSRASRDLRGYEHAFERALLSYEEGRLLHRARSSEAAAERFRRAELEFARLGNDRWRVRCLWGLASALRGAQPAESARAFEAANELARTADMAPPTLPPAASAEDASIEAIRETVEALQAWIEDSWGSGAQKLEAGRALDRHRRLLADRFDLTQVELRLGQETARQWREGGLPQTPPGFDAIDRGAELHFSWSREDARDTDRQWLTLLASRSPELELAVARPNRFTPLDTALIHLIGRALEPAMTRWLGGEQAIPPARSSLPPVGTEEPDDVVRTLVGESDPMRSLRALIRQVAPTNATVLIVGESGTGKELVARALHEASPRRGAAFVAVNCPSIPRELMESELFGHERGAFTGAIAARAGKIEVADGGTLFLDEVADMDPAVQAKLLRFLEQREVERVGGGKLRKVDVRVVAATSQSLEERILDGRFREDLFYRLNVVPVRMPPLRDRRADIPMLVEHILTVLREGTSGGARRLEPEALRLLAAHDWPGNVRELRNVLHYLVAIGGSETISAADLPTELRSAVASASRVESAIRPGETLAARLAEVESALVRATLEQCGWNQSAAARRLGVTEGTVRARMRQYGIAPPPSRGGTGTTVPPA